MQGEIRLPPPGPRDYETGEWEAAEKLDRMIRCHLKDLKATKIARERDTAQGPATTPAEWATTLVEKLAGSRKKSSPKTAAGIF